MKYFQTLIIGDIHGSLKYLNSILNTMVNYKYIIIVGDISFDRNRKFFEKTVLTISQKTNAKILIARGEHDPLILKNIPENVVLENVYRENDLCFYILPPLISYELKIPLEADIAKFEKPICQLCSETETLILVSHIPPYRLRVDYDIAKGNIGSYMLRKIIEKCQPKMVFCGHVHSGRTIVRHNRTLIVNPGPLRRGFFAITFFSQDTKKPKTVILDRL